jgi:beta-1,4-mannooligosaccharide/beta-1,4-mannosyl-N-acetylglucosamine phosphorylase
VPLRRAGLNPLLTREDVQLARADLRDVSSVFNPGAARWRGRELLLLRVQTRGRTTVLVPAERLPNRKMRVFDQPISIEGIETLAPPPAHVYDPRLTVIDDVLYAVLACDLAGECRLLTARTHDFQRWEMVGFDADGDRRNGVLFPERIDGRFARLQRPNLVTREGAPPTGSTITLATSDDLSTWTEDGPVMHGRPQRWDEIIGSGPPPVKTREGWLHVYHGVATHFAASNVYQAGVVLLDLADPTRVVARGAFNVLEPRETWELTGQVPNVVFPSGMVVEEMDDDGFAVPDAKVRIYYGAADTVVGLATSTLAELLADARFAG